MADSRVSVSSFIASLQKNPLLQNNKFEISFAGNVKPIDSAGKTISFSSNINNDINVYLIKTNLPGRQIGTSDIREHGPNRKVPIDVVYGELSMSFYLDKDKKIYDLFTNWTEAVAQTRSTKPVNGLDFGGQLKVGYYENYAGGMSVEIVILDSKTLDKTIAVRYHEVYPYQIDDVDLDKNSTDGLIQYTVKFAYRGLEVI